MLLLRRRHPLFRARSGRENRVELVAFLLPRLPGANATSNQQRCMAEAFAKVAHGLQEPIARAAIGHFV